MFLDVYRCFTCFDDYDSAEVHHGCLVKERNRVFVGLQLGSLSPSTVEACARACDNKIDCDTFDIENGNLFGKTCYLYAKGEVHAIPSEEEEEETAGFCPKGIVCDSTHYLHTSYLSFFSTETILGFNFFSTQKRVNCNRTDFAT